MLTSHRIELSIKRKKEKKENVKARYAELERELAVEKQDAATTANGERRHSRRSSSESARSTNERRLLAEIGRGIEKERAGGGAGRTQGRGSSVIQNSSNSEDEWWSKR